jgi:hypothetical protein
MTLWQLLLTSDHVKMWLLQTVLGIIGLLIVIGFALLNRSMD